MKHTLLTRLDSKISLIASELDQVQALTLAGLRAYPEINGGHV